MSRAGSVRRECRMARMTMKRWTPQDRLELWRRWEAGESYKAIGETVGVTQERVRQLVGKAVREHTIAWSRSHPFPDFDAGAYRLPSWAKKMAVSLGYQCE